VPGALSAIIQITLIGIPYERYYYSHFAHVGQGIWCGIFFLVTGGLGLAAAQRPSNCTIITLMVFSILSACMTIPHMTLDGIGAGYSSNYRWNDGTALGLYCFLFILGLKAGIVSIVISSYTCRAVCCRKVKANGTVMYNPAGLQHTALPLGNMADLTKVVATAQNQVNAVQQQQQPEQEPPAYNSVAQMCNAYSPPPAAVSKDTGTQECAKKEPDADSVAGGEEYKRFY